MGEDIAGPQRIHQHRQIAGRIADMAHHAALGAGTFHREDGALERLDAVVADESQRLADLGAEHKVRILGDGARRGIDIGVVDVEQFADRETGQADGGNVHEGEQPAARLRRHQPFEAGEIVGARIARADVGGCAGKRHQFVGRDADRRAVGIDMRVQVDETRRHQLALGVDALLALFRRDGWLDRRDLSETNADIAHAAQPLTRIDHLAAADHQIESRRGLLAECRAAGAQSCRARERR